MGRCWLPNTPAWPPSRLHPPSPDSSPGVLLGEGRDLHAPLKILFVVLTLQMRKLKPRLALTAKREAWGHRVISCRTGTKSSVILTPWQLALLFIPINPLAICQRTLSEVQKIMTESCFCPSLPFMDHLLTDLYHFHYSSLYLRVKW